MVYSVRYTELPNNKQRFYSLLSIHPPQQPHCGGFLLGGIVVCYSCCATVVPFRSLYLSGEFPVSVIFGRHTYAGNSGAHTPVQPPQVQNGIVSPYPFPAQYSAYQPPPVANTVQGFAGRTFVVFVVAGTGFCTAVFQECITAGYRATVTGHLHRQFVQYECHPWPAPHDRYCQRSCPEAGTQCPAR